MSKKNQQQEKLTFFGISAENAREIISRISPEEHQRILERAQEAGRNISSREDRYFERVPDEILKKPFEIVK